MRAWVRDLWILSHMLICLVYLPFCTCCVPMRHPVYLVANWLEVSSIFPRGLLYKIFILVRTLHQFLSGCQVHTLKTNTMDRYMYALAYLRDINVPMLVEAGQLMIFAVHIQETHKEQQHSKQCGVFSALFLCGRYLELLPGHTRLRALWKRGS